MSRASANRKSAMFRAVRFWALLTLALSSCCLLGQGCKQRTVHRVLLKDGGGVTVDAGNTTIILERNGSKTGVVVYRGDRIVFFGDFDRGAFQTHVTTYSNNHEVTVSDLNGDGVPELRFKTANGKSIRRDVFFDGRFRQGKKSNDVWYVEGNAIRWDGTDWKRVDVSGVTPQKSTE